MRRGTLAASIALITIVAITGAEAYPKTLEGGLTPHTTQINPRETTNKALQGPLEVGEAGKDIYQQLEPNARR